MNKDYIVNKLTRAVDALILGPGDIRSRLILAHICLCSLRKSDFPKELQADWDWINEQLTKYGPLTGPSGQIRGSVENTMRRIHNSTGTKIAERILRLYRSVSNN